MLLVADPDAGLVRQLSAAMQAEGVDVTGVPDGAQALLQDGRRTVLTIGDVELDVTAYQVKVGGRVVHLPLREFELLHYLMRNVDRTVTRERIMRDVWRSTDGMATNTIAVHVKRLRARLGDMEDTMIQTVRGVGYRMVSG
ncbi:MAG: response regulator transcription factor [Microbispora sp.]|nr:response regulator transcription factor [Microbispora sp.]